MIMDRRIRKRIAIAVVFFFILGGLFWGGFLLFKPAPTCFDNQQNQGEEGVDCGGPCASCELKTLKPLEALNAKLFVIDDNFAVGFAKLRNPNLRWSAARISGKWEIADGEDALLGSFDDLLWVRNGETKHLVYFLEKEAAVPSWQRAEKIKLVLNSAVSWVPASATPEVPILIRERAIERTAKETRVEGVLRNDSRFDLDRVSTIATVSAKSGSLIAAGKAELRTLRSGEERFFSIVLPMPFDTKSVGEVEVFADTNIFDDQNFLRRR